MKKISKEEELRRFLELVKGPRDSFLLKCTEVKLGGDGTFVINMNKQDKESKA